MARHKKPEPIFEVLFEGEGVYPETIPLGSLNQALSAIRRLASGADLADESDEQDDDSIAIADDDGRISLLDVKRGSALLRFVCPAAVAAIENLRGVGKVLDDPEAAGERDYVLNPIRRLSAVAKSLGCSIIVRENASDDGVLATIVPLSYQHISESLFISGDTSFTGFVERVGGATSMRCGLRVPFQHRMLFCSVASQDVAKQLGDCLYQNVTVSGNVVWIKKTWRVVSFTILGVTKTVDESLSDAFKVLRDAGGDGWDKIDDPESFLEEVSGK